MSNKITYGITKSVTLSWKRIDDMIKAGASKEEIREALSALYKKAYEIGGEPKMFTRDENGKRIPYVRGPSKYQKKQMQ